MKVAISTLGCKVNQYESDVLKGLFEKSGFENVPPEAFADVYVVNSCTVTATGDSKTRKLLRRLRGQNPNACVVLTGCFPQAFPAEAAALTDADILTGTKERSKLPALVTKWLADKRRQVDILPLDFQHGEDFEPLGGAVATERTRAFLKIQDGCERFCAYCIIPSARGPLRSRTTKDIGAQATLLAQQGFRELVLVGINLSCYGVDLGLSLFDGVAAAAVKGIERIRLGSLEPELLTPENISRLGQIKELCPQFHLSLQSGCDTTLKRMNRHYSTSQYAKIVRDLRGAFPSCAITTDVMVGFPGETEAEFQASLDFCAEIGFAKVHVFPYSPRPGTAAASMPDVVPKQEKHRRAKKLSDSMDAVRLSFLQKQIGSTAKVLLETEVSPHLWQGYTENYTPVQVPFFGDGCGVVLNIKMTGAQMDFCTAEVCEGVGQDGV